MNLESQIDKLLGRGFSEERAEAILLMREAAIVLFDAFPETLVLVGGANLVFFQDSVRHSADLDLFPISGELPAVVSLREVLLRGLKPLAELLKLNPLNLDAVHAGPEEIKMMLSSNSGKTLFTVDITKMGSVLKSGIDECMLEAAGVDCTAGVKFASRDQMLLQKAEAFLFRKTVKARDAYDAMDLMHKGAVLKGNLRNYLEDMLRGEFAPDRLRERIEQVDARRCRAELRDRLPEDVYGKLERADFQPIRDALLRLFHEWLRGE